MTLPDSCRPTQCWDSGASRDWNVAKAGTQLAAVLPLFFAGFALYAGRDCLDPPGKRAAGQKINRQ